MDGAFEGDLIRPLGLVTLYCGYAEQELNELLRALSPADAFVQRTYRWPVGQKLSHAEDLIGELDTDGSLGRLRAALVEGRRLFDRRNALVHGSLYTGGRLSSNGEEATVEHVTSKDLTTFADRVFAWKERLWLYRQKDLLAIQRA